MLAAELAITTDTQLSAARMVMQARLSEELARADRRMDASVLETDRVPP